jgi:hypothetical protein
VRVLRITAGKKQIKIGGQPCADVVVLSENFLMCKVPLVGTANQSGQTLTLTGNELGGITKVEVGGVDCSDFNVNGAGTTCTFTLPSLPAGEVDIMLTVGSNNDVYRFAKVFEYQ